MFQKNPYDAVIIGARCAGAATAMLLARRGKRVLLLDRATEGSDTLSTHALMRGGVMQLSRWGLLDRLVACGTPAVSATRFGYGDDMFDVDIKPREHAPALFAPRRTVLDRLLVEAAREAGAEVRFRTRFDSLLRDAAGVVTGVCVEVRGERVDVRAELVIGADGMRSSVAREVEAETVVQGVHATASIYSYVEGLPGTGYEWRYGERAAAGLIPTNGGHCVFVSCSSARFRAGARDPKALYAELLEEAAPDAAPTVLRARRIGRMRRFAGRPGHLKKPHGPGWALVGDAGYYRDPLTAHGITDALRDAELLARQVGRGPEGLAQYAADRDAVCLDVMEITERVASFKWDLTELAQLHVELSGAMRAEVDALSRLPTQHHRHAA